MVKEHFIFYRVAHGLGGIKGFPVMRVVMVSVYFSVSYSSLFSTPI
jgi:hypothetical protein